ncbi:hypothetical protein BEN47_13765 [Hymenobacter lapidarius]|uniref:Uncharacterized protein n=1 Tax=Hymenobacter lapidarius TaxID=1908237 RepID=A0A1G1T5A3_9BACT|nr:hypothetical protein BEN47_13765 [Hymenobacter lapidarius]
MLLDLNLQQLPDDYFSGEWQVASRVLNRNDPGSPLALATRLLLDPSRLETQSEAPALPQTGSWAVMRDEILNRPYLSFELPTEVTRALVTRLRRSADGLQSQLNLYFASGMEMQLFRPQSSISNLSVKS